MCGITGFFGTGNEAVLKSMTETLSSRGPDSSGFYIDNDIPLYLGHRRLVVLDRRGGIQPMWDSSFKTCVIFNGEIYNHHKLRKELESLGHRFSSSHSDTETLVYGWQQWGEKMFPFLDGMFALAIYDRTKNQIILARDRFGEKPLYYSSTNHTFIFGSEISPLLKHPALQSKELSNISLQKYFAHGFFPATHSPYKKIKKLLPGEILKVNLKDISITTGTYWKFTLGDNELPAGNEIDWAEELKIVLKEAVKSRLESDVPLGFFLSGGIDSSSILVNASKYIDPSNLKTFSIGFKETSFDESKIAQNVANFLGTDHYNKTCVIDDAKHKIPNLLRKLDEPIGDPSIFPTHMLCEFARKKVTVALSGDGGDELFAGYDPFRALKFASLYDQIIPRPVHESIKFLAAKIPRSDINLGMSFIINKFLRGLKNPASLWNPLWLSPLSPQDISELFLQPLEADELYSEAIDEWDNLENHSIVDRSLSFYTRFYLPDGVLTKTDRASMSVGLEVRSPMLANNLTSFVQKLPWHSKIKNQKTKWILKKAMYGELPDFVLNRKKKGFGFPISSWLSEINPPKKDLASINNEWLRNRWKKHQTGKNDERQALWCWIALTHAIGQ